MAEDKFNSRWEFTKSTSRWHFDKGADEDASPPYRKIGWFTGADLSPIIEYCLKVNKPSTLLNRLGEGKTPYTSQLDRNDLEALGYGAEHVLYQRTEKEMFYGQNWPRVIAKIVSFFAMEKVNISIHTQMPGQTFPVHIDNLTTLRDNSNEHLIRENPDAAARFTVQLTDWEWGHVWGFGNTYWKQWRAGEIAFHSWCDIPHFTANAGHSPRVSLQISGLVTERTRQILTHPKHFTVDLSRAL